MKISVTDTHNSTILRDAIGVLWMTTAGTLAAIGVVLLLSTSFPLVLVLIAVVALACSVLYPRAITMFRVALRLPRVSSPARDQARKQVTRRFGAIVASEMVLFLVANLVLLAIQHEEFLVPTILLIVGVHFFFVAALFQLWPYYVTALFFCLGAIIPILTTSYSLKVGLASSWIVLPTAICALTAWLTAGGVLRIQANRLRGNLE